VTGLLLRGRQDAVRTPRRSPRIGDLTQAFCMRPICWRRCWRSRCWSRCGRGIRGRVIPIGV